MRLYTARINYAGPDRLDITVKSADPAGRVLAPTWQLVKGVKVGAGDKRWQVDPISTDEYREAYYGLLRGRYKADPTAFDRLLDLPELTLCCYCNGAVNEFCHRFLAVDVLTRCAIKSGKRVDYLGERCKHG